MQAQAAQAVISTLLEELPPAELLRVFEDLGNKIFNIAISFTMVQAARRRRRLNCPKQDKTLETVPAAKVAVATAATHC